VAVGKAPIDTVPQHYYILGKVILGTVKAGVKVAGVHKT